MSINFEGEGKQIATVYTPDDEPVKYVYINEEQDGGIDKVRLNDHTSFFPVIVDFEEDEQVDRIYICGETGCGKSTYMRQYVLHFLTGNIQKQPYYYLAVRQTIKH